MAMDDAIMVKTRLEMTFASKIRQNNALISDVPRLFNDKNCSILPDNKVNRPKTTKDVNITAKKA